MQDIGNEDAKSSLPGVQSHKKKIIDLHDEFAELKTDIDSARKPDSKLESQRLILFKY